MDITTWLLVAALIIVVIFVTRSTSTRESFIDMPDLMAMSTQALDAPPSTSELKNHYKALLIYIDNDLRNGNGINGLRIAADFRDRVYGRCDFRADLKTDDVLANWPNWLPPLDTTIQEPVPPVADAVTAEAKMLAYLARNFPMEPSSDETASTVTKLLDDFGYRFVFKKGSEVESVAPTFAPRDLLKDWVNPVGAQNTRTVQVRQENYRRSCIKSVGS